MTDSGSRLTGRIWELQLVAVAATAIATLLTSVLPTLSFGYRNADLHVALETAASLVSALAAFLLYGRFRRTQMLSDLVLFLALTVLALYNVAAAFSPAATGTLDRQAVWVPLFAQLLASSALAGAAFAPKRSLRRPRLAPWLTLGAVAAVGVAVLAGLLLGPHLATGIDPNLSPASSDHPRVIGTPGLLACQLVAMSLLAAAAVGFTVRARRGGDELLGWLALAATIAAFSRLNYFLFPSGYSEWVFSGDFLRLGCYVLILIAAAAERALADSRGAIVALAAPQDEPLGASVARLAGTLARRSGIELKLEMEEGVETTAERREALLRIVSEAISNAVRHGSPSTITVRLSAEPHVRLAIADDGAGFDPAQLDGAGGGSGIEWMRERTARLGGAFALRAAPGEGTEVEVSLP